MLKVTESTNSLSRDFENNEFATKYLNGSRVAVINKTDSVLLFTVEDSDQDPYGINSITLKRVEDVSMVKEGGIILAPHEKRIIGDVYNQYTFDYGIEGMKAKLLFEMRGLQKKADKFSDHLNGIRELAKEAGVLSPELDEKFSNLVIGDDMDSLKDAIKSVVGDDVVFEEKDSEPSPWDDSDDDVPLPF